MGPPLPHTTSLQMLGVAVNSRVAFKPWGLEATTPRAQSMEIRVGSDTAKHVSPLVIRACMNSFVRHVSEQRPEIKSCIAGRGPTQVTLPHPHRRLLRLLLLPCTLLMLGRPAERLKKMRSQSLLLLV